MGGGGESGVGGQVVVAAQHRQGGHGVIVGVQISQGMGHGAGGGGLVDHHQHSAVLGLRLVDDRP